MSADVGQCQQCHIRVGHGRKCGGSLWNRFEICFRSKVISTSGFYFRFRGRHLSFRCRPMSDNVGSVIFWSGMVENVGVAAETASKSISVQKLFLLPVLVAAISNFGCRPMSDHVVMPYLGRALSKM